MNKASVNISVQVVFVCVCVDKGLNIFGVRTYKWDCLGPVVSNFIRNCRTLFQSDCATLHLSQLCREFQLLHILTSIWYCQEYFLPFCGLCFHFLLTKFWGIYWDLKIRLQWDYKGIPVSSVISLYTSHLCLSMLPFHLKIACCIMPEWN